MMEWLAFSIIPEESRVRICGIPSLAFEKCPPDIDVQGGMMPELDSHPPSQSHSDPLSSPFSPWHAAGPDYPSYSAAMKRQSHLSFISAVCRLAPGDTNTGAATQQWERFFGVSKSGNTLQFTNAKLEFIQGEQGKPEGLVSITIGVKGKDNFNKILETASKEDICGDGWINMVGVKWYFVLLDESASKSKL